MKKFLTFVSLAMILFAGITAAIQMAAMPRTYEGQNATVPVAVLQENPEAYDDSTADGAAAVFRGYDTMGEAFILITAVAGSAVILFTKKAGKEETKDEE